MKMEVFAKPAGSGIIIKSENGLIQITGGKIREFENVFNCLRREVQEETGLNVTEIIGQNDAVIIEANGYKVINYEPFACFQNIQGNYPIMVQTFICKVEGQILDKTNETQNIRWVSIDELREMLDNKEEGFNPMDVTKLKKYLSKRQGQNNQILCF